MLSTQKEKNMERFTKKLSGEEVRGEFILLQRGRENLFPTRGEFEVKHGEDTFKAFVEREEDKSMGPRKKTYKFMITFTEEKPPVFQYRKTVVFEGEDKSWTVTVE